MHSKHRASTQLVALLILLQALTLSPAATGRETGPAAAPAASSPAGKASFDCGKASHWQEKLICATPALSSLDGAVAEAYRAVLSKLAGGPKNAFRDSQREWVTYRQELCPPVKSEPDGHAPAKCLRRIYQERLESLSKALRNIGHYTFLTIQRTRAGIGQDEEGHATYSSFVVAVPLIVAPSGPDTDRFNAEMESWADLYLAPAKGDSEFDDDTDYFGSTIIQHADDALICVQLFDGSYSHGSAHGLTEITSVNWLWREGRTLRAEDLFRPKSNWQDTLARLAFEELKTLVGEELTVKEPGELRRTAEDPRNWIVTSEEISIQFGQYEVGPYAIGTPTAGISWAALKACLVESPPLKFK